MVQRGNLNINAAVSLPGVQTDTFSNDPPCGGCYSIDGRDWRLADSSSPSGTTPTKLGIATYTGTETSTGLTYEANAEAGFNTAAKQAYVQGKHDTGALTDGPQYDRRGHRAQSDRRPELPHQPGRQPADPDPQQHAGLPVRERGLEQAGGPGMNSTSTANPVTITNNCTGADQINQTVNLGTATNPAMVYVKGEFDPARTSSAWR